MVSCFDRERERKGKRKGKGRKGREGGKGRKGKEDGHFYI